VQAVDPFPSEVDSYTSNASQRAVLSIQSAPLTAAITGSGRGINAVWLQKVGRLIDANNDTLLSSEELRSFAQVIKDKQRLQQSSVLLHHLDRDRTGDVSLAELQAASSNATEARTHQALRFAAADADANGRLGLAEFNAFVHPEIDERVFRVEKDHKFGLYDADASGFIDKKEFLTQSHSVNMADFDEKAAQEDFQLHDSDRDGQLCAEEFGRLLLGHDLLSDSIARVIEAGDGNGDGHIHIDKELPSRLQYLMDSEYVEDFFLHPQVNPGYDEL